MWAHSPSLKLLPGEAEVLAEIFRDPRSHLSFLLAGKKFIVLEVDGPTLYARARSSAGLALSRTRHLMVLGLNPGYGRPGECVYVVATFADFLYDQGY